MRIRTLVIHASLLVLTFLTMAFAGVAWLNKNPIELTNFVSGIPYAVLLLVMLLSHEMGHYLMARRHGVEATLPYFRPFPSFILGLFPFGTLGAVIQLRSPVQSRRALLDIGAGGPIAGFIVSVVYLVIGFITLPSIDFLYEIHPEYVGLSQIPTEGLTFGRNLIYSGLEAVVPSPGAFIPPMNELYHYPFLCVGWFGIFVTAMNLIPVGQLDGGHITRAMFGGKSLVIGRIVMGVLAVLGLLGFLPLIGMSDEWGWSGWLFWAVVLFLFFERRRRGVLALPDDTPLDQTRMTFGWFCLWMFVVGFAIAPFTIGIV
ncbi:MAG: site-2 protease family protein [Bacteroidetes bacterium]|nr:site-2 protease family protein [Bacteroidota bacterium]